MKAKAGDLVKVRAFGGLELVRRLIELRERKAVLTTDEELKRAKEENREPIQVGFPLVDITEVITE